MQLGVWARNRLKRTEYRTIKRHLLAIFVGIIVITYVLHPIDDSLVNLGFHKGKESSLNLLEISRYVNYQRVRNESQLRTLSTEKMKVIIDNKRKYEQKQFYRKVIKPPPNEKFTAVIPSFCREVQVTHLVTTYFQNLSHILDKILIVHTCSNRTDDVMKQPNKTAVPVQVIEFPDNNLNYRFYPFDEIKTEAVLHMDDDIVIESQAVERMFRIWQHHRQQIVAVTHTARTHSWTRSNKLIYGKWAGFSMLGGGYLSMGLTKFAFLHKYYSSLYTSTLPSPIWDRVHYKHNCEDIAMNFLASYISRKPPIFVNCPVQEECFGCPSNTGLSSRPWHYDDRSVCLKEFTNHFGAMPLQKQYNVLDCFPQEEG